MKESYIFLWLFLFWGGDKMIPDTIIGAIYLSIIDMVLLSLLLFMIGTILKAFPLINKIEKLFNRNKR